MVDYIVQTRFMAHEIVSRQWRDSAGNMIEYLGQTNLLANSNQSITAVSYGHKATSKVACVDFYSVSEEGLYYVNGSFLMCHDNGPGVVVSFTLDRRAERTYVVVRRHFSEIGTGRLMESRTDYEITGGLLMVQSPHRYLSPVE